MVSVGFLVVEYLPGSCSSNEGVFHSIPRGNIFFCSLWLFLGLKMQPLFDTKVHWDEVYAALDELGWSQAELARRLGLEAHAVTRWKQRGRAPMYAIAYLEQILIARDIRDRLHEDVRVRR